MFFAIGSFIFYAAMAWTFLFRLFPHWATHVPGGLQDTRFLLWNDWWFHYAIETLHSNPFKTSFLYHPFGTSLVLSDYPLWNSLVTYMAQRHGANVIAAANWSFILSWALAGFATYLLAKEVTRHRAPSMLAGLYVMTHSFTLICTMQNWTRFNMFGIPLFLWTLVRARRTGRDGYFLLSGLALAWTAACHYYFFVYCLMIWLAVLVVDLSPVGLTLQWQSLGQRQGWRRAGLVLAVLAGSAALWITRSHPTEIVVLGIRIGLKTPYNAILVMWLGLYVWFLGGWTLSLYRRPATALQPDGTWRKHAMLLATAFVSMLPLTWSLFAMALSGDYPHQSLLWKTERAGANLFSFFMPNPMHAWWGPAVSEWFTSRGMVIQEQTASIGWVLLGLFALARPWKGDQTTKRWLALALGAMALALGTYLHVAQVNLWLPMPFYIVRLLPVIGKARLPDHWMTVGAVATGVVAALSIVKVSADRRWSLSTLSALIGILILLENWPRIPFEPLPSLSPIYKTLRDAPAGAVLPVPLFVGDAIVGVGDARRTPMYFPWDYLWYQTVYEKPMLGGYMGRMSPKILMRYQADPFMNTLLRIEDNKIPHSTPMPNEGRQAIEDFNFRYVMIYSEATSTQVVRYVSQSLPLEEVEKDGSLTLYRVKGGRSGSAL